MFEKARETVKEKAHEIERKATEKKIESELAFIAKAGEIKFKKIGGKKGY